MAKENEKYNGTINLPKPLLPMKANLPQTEETWLKFWEDDNVLKKRLRSVRILRCLFYMMVLLMQMGYSLRDCSE